MTRLRPLAAVVLLVTIAACATTPAAPSPSPSNPASSAPPSPAPSGPGQPSGEPSATPSGHPTPSVKPSPTPSAPQLPQDAIARVVTDGLRVRSKPEVSDASKKLTPLLDAPRLLYIVDGPVEASGYTWYEVAPIADAGAREELPFGWVAAADKDGTPWIERAVVDCPARPTTPKALWAMNGIVGLACFGESPITIQARLAQPEATCGVDIGWSIEPDWLGSTCPQPRFLVESTSEVGLSINSIIDPDVDVSRFNPGVDPEDWVTVRITGRFDHPAATSCHGVSTWAAVPYGSDQIVLSCRATFVITKIAAA